MNEIPPDLEYGTIDSFAAIEKAIEHTKFMLFKPFNLGKWFALGFVIWIAALANGGGVPTWGLDFSKLPLNKPPNETIGRATDFMRENLAMILLGAGIAMIVSLAIMALLGWLRARASLMLVRAVALNDERIGENWRAVKPLSGSLFAFIFVFWVLRTIAMFASVALGIALVRLAHSRGANTFLEYWPYVGWALILFLLTIGVSIPVTLLLHDFVIPVMYRFNVRCTDAWRIVFRISSGNVISLTVFYLLKMVVGMVMGVVRTLAVLLTCCIGALPIVNQTIIAPIHIFSRAFSMFALETMSPDFRMIEQVRYDTDPFDDHAQRDLTDY